MIQINGFVYHSPLIIRCLIPTVAYAPIYLELKWTASDMKSVGHLIDDAKHNNNTIVLMGSLSSLQLFFDVYPDITARVKVLLFDAPGLVNPAAHPLLNWVDSDLQSGGAWQIVKVKYDTIVELLDRQAALDESGREFLKSMYRFLSPDRTNEIEKFAENMPDSYKDLVKQMQDKNFVIDKNVEQDTVKDTAWKKKTLTDLLVEMTAAVSTRSKRKMLFDLVMDYFLQKITKKSFTSEVNKLDDSLKKRVGSVRKWMDAVKLGSVLRLSYFDTLVNLKTRSWKTILEDHGVVADKDLLLIMARQPCDDNVLALYKDELVSVSQLPANMNPPEAAFPWSDGLLHYHPELLGATELLETLKGNRDENTVE